MNRNGIEIGRRLAPVCGLRTASVRDGGDRKLLVERRGHLLSLLAAAQLRRTATARSRSVGVAL